MAIFLKISVTLFLSYTSILCYSQVHKIPCKLQELVKLPKALNEVSGMTWCKDGFWVHNDSGNDPFIMLMKMDGKIESIKEITSAPNYDWEDIATDTKGNIYIGDIGNNLNTRRTLQVYKIPNPSSTTSVRIPAEKIEFSYADQKLFPPKENRLVYDAEALLFFNDSIFIFNKNRTQPFDGFVRMYKVPAKAGSYEAHLADSLYLGGEAKELGWITGADISRDGKKVALLTHEKVWLFTDFKSSNFFKGRIGMMDLKHFSQKEAICFDDQNKIFIADELFENVLGGKLYQINME